jgi:hypothetical protein
MAVDLMNKTKMRLFSHAFARELAVQAYSLASHVIVLSVVGGYLFARLSMCS